MRIFVNTVFILTSRKTEIARSARGPKSQGKVLLTCVLTPFFVRVDLGAVSVASKCCPSQVSLAE